MLQRNVDKRIIRDVFISCFPHKKRTKEGGWGEALTAKSFVTSCGYQHDYPAFEPPSPQTPSRPPSKAGWDSFSVLAVNSYNHLPQRNIDYSKSTEQRRKGYIGEGGSKPGKHGKRKMQAR